ncbi:MAG TPA: hypothetical protein VN229_18910 [Terriglobales bacterium]|nr:hypothetical protein [Terriglobales bacterium]
MSSIGRRQAGADQEKFDLSKKTIRDVAAELARRSQPTVLTGGQQSVTPLAPAMPTSEAAATEPAAGSNPGAGNPGGEGNDPSPSNLIQMDPRSAAAQPAAAPNPLWAEHRPFADDPAGPTPLEALSRALDHKLFDLPDNIALTPSSEMTKELAPPPLVVPPSAAHPTVNGAELPLQEGAKTVPPRDQLLHETKAAQQPIRHYPSPRFSLLNRLRGIWLHYSLQRSPKSASAPMQRGDVDWSTLSLGVGIGLIAGVGAIMLLSKSPSDQSALHQSADTQQPAVSSTATLPAATTTLPSPASIPPLPTTPSAVEPSAVEPSEAGLPATNPPAPKLSFVPPPMVGTVPAALHPRDMTATTFGIPASLQPDKLAASGSGSMPASAAENPQAATGASSAGSNNATITPTTQKPAKTATKSKAKPAQKSSAGQHTPKASEQLSPAKR